MPRLRWPRQVARARSIRMDPVQIRVAIPAADPPDDITHEILFAPKLAPCALLWKFNVCFLVFLSPAVVH